MLQHYSGWFNLFCKKSFGTLDTSVNPIVYIIRLQKIMFEWFEFNSREASKLHCGVNNLHLYLCKYTGTMKIIALLYTYITSISKV